MDNMKLQQNIGAMVIQLWQMAERVEVLEAEKKAGQDSQKPAKSEVPNA